jgi:large subunit ribosomal protein L5e
LTAACSKELPRYDTNYDITNWAVGELSSHCPVHILTIDFPAYTTGLISARRALTKLGLGDKHEGVTTPDGIHDAESKDLDVEEVHSWYHFHLLIV